MEMKEALAFLLAPVEDLLAAHAPEEEIITASREGMALFMNLYEERKDPYQEFTLNHIVVTVSMDCQAFYLYLIPELMHVPGVAKWTREVYKHTEQINERVCGRVFPQTAHLWERDFFLILADYDDQDRLIGLEFLG